MFKENPTEKLIPQLLATQEWFDQDAWSMINRKLLAKMIREFHYEGLITTEKTLDDFYQFTPKAGIEYRFRAQLSLLTELIIDESSITRVASANILSTAYTVTPMQLILDLYETLTMKEFTTTYFVEELLRTLLSDLHLLKGVREKSWDFLLKGKNAHYAFWDTIGLGHPWLAVGKGRMGLSWNDDLHFTPEAQTALSICYLAVKNEFCQYTSFEYENLQKLLEEEVSAAQLAQFQKKLINLGKNPEDYKIVPIHPWQFDRIGVTFFLPLLCQHDMIWLGASEDLYVPQQAIRTLSNFSHPKKKYLKMTLNIFNTAVFRGLPPKRVMIAPHLSQWLQKITVNDSYLTQNHKVILLGEVAGLSVNHPYFDQIPHAPYQYHESVGAIWRESIDTYLANGEKAMGLSALLFENHTGESLIGQLIKSSGLPASVWMEKFHSIILTPLLHYLYRYGVAFNAHAQNLILVMKDFVPTRLAIKDFSDDVNILEGKDHPELAQFPAACRGVVLEQPPEVLLHFIFSSLFICFYRYLAEICAKDPVVNLTEKTFWSYARQAVLAYQKEFPEYQEGYQAMDFLQPEHLRVCLNRVRALTFGYAHDAGRPEPALWGNVPNPLAACTK